MSVLGGKAEDICSFGAFQLLTQSRTSVGFQRRANSRGITAPTAFHNGRNVALAVPTRLFLSPSPPSLERVSHPRLPQYENSACP